MPFAAMVEVHGNRADIAAVEGFSGNDQRRGTAGDQADDFSVLLRQIMPFLDARLPVRVGFREQGLEIMRLEMKLADLSARLAKPRKGDRPDLLNEEYLRLAEELQKVKKTTS